MKYLDIYFEWERYQIEKLTKNFDKIWQLLQFVIYIKNSSRYLNDGFENVIYNLYYIYILKLLNAIRVLSACV